jgi:hypothetical protein
MSFITDNKTYIICITIAIIIIVYFLIDYQIKNTLIKELQRIRGEKHKKIKIQRIKQQRMQKKTHTEQPKKNTVEKFNQHDMDSYVDPAEKNIDREYGDEDDRNGFNEKLSKDNIYMRDMLNK